MSIPILIDREDSTATVASINNSHTSLRKNCLSLVSNNLSLKDRALGASASHLIHLSNLHLMIDLRVKTLSMQTIHSTRVLVLSTLFLSKLLKRLIKAQSTVAYLQRKSGQQSPIIILSIRKLRKNLRNKAVNNKVTVIERVRTSKKD